MVNVMTKLMRTGSLAMLTFSLVFVGMAGVAGATTFDFTGGRRANPHGLDVGHLGRSFTLTENGIELRVRGFDGPGDRGRVHRNRRGLGIQTRPASNAVGRNESLRFIFSGEPVSIEALILERGNLNGRLDLYVDGDFERTIHWMSGGRTMVSHDLSSIRGRRFEFVGERRSFRIGGLTLTSAIPEPSAALLFGLGGFVAASRALRRR